MAKKFGSFNTAEFKKLQKKLEKVNEKDIDILLKKCAKSLAARMLNLVIKRTPVGVYDNPVTFTTKDGKQVSFQPHTGKTGGTLRRGWTAESQEAAEGGEDMGAVKWANSLTVNRKGDVYEIEIINPVEYASYVEYGHRTANHKGWVPGKFMMTISAKEIEAASSAILEKKVEAFLRRSFKE